jgi:hypothetical protein
MTGDFALFTAQKKRFDPTYECDWMRDVDRDTDKRKSGTPTFVRTKNIENVSLSDIFFDQK